MAWSALTLGAIAGATHGPHERDFDRARGGGRAALLVVFELVAFNAVEARAVFAEELDLHFMQQNAGPSSTARLSRRES